MRRLAAGLLLILVSCGKKETCPPEAIYAALTGYTPSEADTLLVTRFVKGSNLSSPIDSIYITANGNSFVRRADSTFIYSTRLNELSTGEYDLRLINPFDRRSVAISDITHESRQQRRGIFSMDLGSCSSPLVSYRVDNVLVDAQSRRTPTATVYLSR